MPIAAIAKPTGALAFGLLGDGRAGCGGEDPKAACSTKLAISYTGRATLRITGTTATPLTESTKPTYEWVPKYATTGVAKLTDESSWYCNDGSFVVKPVAKKTDCPSSGKVSYLHLLRVQMDPGVNATGDFGEGFVRVKIRGEVVDEVVDEVALRFVAPTNVSMAANPQKPKYNFGDYVSYVPTFTATGVTEQVYSEEGLIDCVLDPASAGNASLTRLKTLYGRSGDGVELSFERFNVVIKIKCTVVAGLNFDQPLVLTAIAAN